MKHNLVVLLGTLIYLTIVPLLFLGWAATGLFIPYLVLDHGRVSGNVVGNSGPIRIRTIARLEPVAPAQVATPPAVVEVEVIIPEQASAEPVVVAPTLSEPPEPASSTEVLIDPLSVAAAEDTAMVAEAAPAPVEPPVPVEPAAPQAAAPETAADDELPVTSPLAETINPPDDLPVIEFPAEPVVVEPAPPVIAANPPPQNNPPAPVESPKSTFVPDSSFFDQLLDQVK